jgi:hypothetical protein
MLKKILLSVSLIALTIGFCGIGQASQWGVSLPLGAVFFILFFIVTLLEKETALYDAEEQRKSAHDRQSGSLPVASGHPSPVSWEKLFPQ